jgi:hypothetical protein
MGLIYIVFFFVKAKVLFKKKRKEKKSEKKKKVYISEINISSVTQLDKLLRDTKWV